MTKEQTFEEYLQQIHAKQYTGTDDDMPEDFSEHWLYHLDTNELIEYAQDYANQQKSLFLKEVRRVKPKKMRHAWNDDEMGRELQKDIEAHNQALDQWEKNIQEALGE